MKLCFVFAFLVFSVFVTAQTTSVEVERNQSAPLSKEIDFSDPQLEDWEPNVLTIQEQPKPASDYGNKKEYLKELRRQKQKQSNALNRNSSRGANPPAPAMLNNFTANNSQGTPNDNHIAVSNGGKIVSVVNTNIKVYNDTGTQLYTRGLSAFASVLGILQSVSDPRVLYDPLTDRFIVIFFAGASSSSATKIIVAFSKTNDPVGAWNFYGLNGNYMNDSTWSDYPIVTIGESDLFMTFNHLKDGEDWKTGFRYSAIWQIDKSKGYAGDTLQFNYWHNVEHNGKPIWSICPVQGGVQPSGPESYFLSVRPGDLTNDTLFLHTISDSYQSGNAQFSSKILKTNISYGLPPNAVQRDGQYLATNDARVLCAMIENNRIQYVQNCVDTQYYTSGFYLGDIDRPSSATPTVSGQIISNDIIDFGYPSIAYIGNNQFDNRSIITCSYSSSDTFPGTVAFYRDANGSLSEMLIVKMGEDAVDVLGDTIERWGDYTGVQRKYNEPNVAWISGSYAHPTQQYRTWVAKIMNADSSLVSSIGEVKREMETKVFPNPSTEKFSVQFELPKDNFTRFEIYDVNGRLIRILLEDYFKAGINIFSFNTQYLDNGIYFLNISDRNNLLRAEKIIISR